RVLTVAASDWNKAKSLIDTTFDGRSGVGQTRAYRALRAKMPERVRALFMVSAQGVVRQMATRFAAFLPPDSPAATPPEDMPTTPALLGGAVVPTAQGFQFQLVVPSSVGTVFEKGLVPLFQGMAGKVNQ